MVTPDDIKTRFTEYSTLTDAFIQMFIDEAYLTVSTGFGTLRDTSIMYFVAHNIAISQKTSNGNLNGEIASQSVDGVSVTYSIPTSNTESQEYLNSTPYGKKYLYYLGICSKGQARAI